jgi:hypothetical protein
MRIACFCMLSAAAMLAFMVAQAYLQGGILLGSGLLVAGTLFLFEAFRRADRAFLAPLQAICQDDYSRELDAVLRPLLAVEDATFRDCAQRVDA